MKYFRKCKKIILIKSSVIHKNFNLKCLLIFKTKAVCRYETSDKKYTETKKL